MKRCADFIVSGIFAPVFIALFFAVSAAAREPVRIACVGDSITDGFGLANPSQDAWPALLGEMLGGGFDVRNFGSSGKTLQKSGDQSYWDERRFRQALDFNPDIVIIKLGTNDAKEANWRGPENFRADLDAMIAEFASLPSKPRIVLGLCAWVRRDSIGIARERVENGVIPVVRDAAKRGGLEILDFHSILKGRPELYCDDIHPNEAGALLMAESAYAFLTGGRQAPKVPKIRGKKSDFSGFSRFDFQFRFRNASLFVPKRPSPDGAWVWAFTAPGDGAAADYAGLLRRGFYILHTDVESWLGNPGSVNWGMEVVKYYSENLGLSKKPVLLGEGAGCFFALNFAAAHPENAGRVALVNPPAPIASWAAESASNMERLLREWHIDAGGVRGLEGLEIRNFALLGKAGVPVLALCSESWRGAASEAAGAYGDSGGFFLAAVAGSRRVLGPGAVSAVGGLSAVEKGGALFNFLSGVAWRGK